MLKKLRMQLEGIAEQKHQTFDDFQKLVKRIAHKYDLLFPNFKENPRGSHCVYDFGIQQIAPITLVKPHRGQEFVPPKFAKMVVQGIEDVLDFIEVKIPDNQSAEEELKDEPSVSCEEAPGFLPEPELPDPTSEG